MTMNHDQGSKDDSDCSGALQASSVTRQDLIALRQRMVDLERVYGAHCATNVANMSTEQRVDLDLRADVALNKLAVAKVAYQNALRAFSAAEVS